jgi:hypothetical protein
MSDMVPPPTPQRGGGGCWKWGAIGCLGLGCLSVVVVVLVSVLFLRSGQGRQIMQVGIETAVVSKDMPIIHQAIGRYVADKGKYPAALSDLVPTYLPESTTRPGGDPTAQPYTYHRPPEGAPGDFTMVEYRIRGPVQGPTASYFVIHLSKDGQVSTSTVQRPASSPPPGEPGGAPSPSRPRGATPE